jgi:hypothetical protein
MKINKNSKFFTPLPKPTLKERLEDLKYTILFWKGRKMKYITTRNLEWNDLRYTVNLLKALDFGTGKLNGLIMIYEFQLAHLNTYKT